MDTLWFLEMNEKQVVTRCCLLTSVSVWGTHLLILHAFPIWCGWSLTVFIRILEAFGKFTKTIDSLAAFRASSSKTYHHKWTDFFLPGFLEPMHENYFFLTVKWKTSRFPTVHIKFHDVNLMGGNYVWNIHMNFLKFNFQTSKTIMSEKTPP